MPLSPSDAASLAAVKRKATLDAEAYVRARIFALEEQAVNDLYRLYAAAYAEMASGLVSTANQYGSFQTWSAADVAYRQRTEAILAQLSTEVERLMGQAVASTLASSVRSYQSGYYGSAWQLDLALRGGAASTLPLLPVEAIRAQILAPYSGSTFVDRFLDARDEFMQRVRKALVESQIRGESIADAQRRLANELGIDIGRRTQAARAANNAYFARTEMIARTELLRASNLGSLEIYEANRDVIKSLEWVATRDERTCPICAPLDGQVFKFGAPQLPPPAHVRCRCTLVPVLFNEALERAIVGKRETYTEWAAKRGISVVNDGGVLRFERGARPPKSPSRAAKQAAGA